MRLLIGFLLPAFLLASPPAAVKNRAPLTPNTFDPLPLTSVRPRGWLLRQLQIQAAGQSGHLDEFWPSLTADSGWLGGPGESWERGPYYLDGLVPLAFLLDSVELKAKVAKWVNWTLANQRPDGAIGPAKNADWWPNFVMLKVLTQYQEATGDQRVIPLMRKYFAYMAANLDQRPLNQWAIYRWGDQAYTIAWLYNRTGDKSLLDLAARLSRQGYDWKAHFANFQWPGKISKKESQLKTHVVNNAMALKTSGVWSWFSGEKSDREAIYSLLGVMDKHHLLPNGVHSGDEHYAGRNPSQGTETCAVVEGMFSLEIESSILGDPAIGDRLEKIAFNPLPGAFDNAMWAHQYDQQPNQVLVDVYQRAWTTNGPQSNLFGLEPNFGCCTANFHQGWPKFAASLWMATADDGLAAVAYAPSEVTTVVKGGTTVKVAETTDYPFRDRIELTVSPEKAVQFPLLLRVPGWATAARIQVNGKVERNVRAGAYHRIERTWKPGDRVSIHLPMQIRVSRWANDSAAIERGPLVFSLKIAEEWKKLREIGPATDWSVVPKSAWNYGILLDPTKPGASIKVVENPVGDRPFGASPPAVILKAKGKQLASWGLEQGSAAAPPASPVRSDSPIQTLELIPYAAAKLRITAFPLIEP